MDARGRRLGASVSLYYNNSLHNVVATEKVPQTAAAAFHECIARCVATTLKKTPH